MQHLQRNREALSSQNIWWCWRKRTLILKKHEKTKCECLSANSTSALTVLTVAATYFSVFIRNVEEWSLVYVRCDEMLESLRKCRYPIRLTYSRCLKSAYVFFFPGCQGRHAHHINFDGLPKERKSARLNNFRRRPWRGPDEEKRNRIMLHILHLPAISRTPSRMQWKRFRNCIHGGNSAHSSNLNAKTKLLLRYLLPLPRPNMPWM